MTLRRGGRSIPVSLPVGLPREGPQLDKYGGVIRSNTRGADVGTNPLPGSAGRLPRNQLVRNATDINAAIAANPSNPARGQILGRGRAFVPRVATGRAAVRVRDIQKADAPLPTSVPEIDETDVPLLIRPRFEMAGGSAVQEPLLQQLADVTRAGLFSFKAANDEMGENNSLYLDNLKNDVIRYTDADVKPFNSFAANEPNVLGFKSEILDGLYASAYNQIGELRAQNKRKVDLISKFAGKSVLPESNLVSRNAFNSKLYKSMLVEGAPLPPPRMRPDYQYDGPPAGFENYLGFKPWDDQQREPLMPSSSYGPDLDPRQQRLRQYLGTQMWTV